MLPCQDQAYTIISPSLYSEPWWYILPEITVEPEISSPKKVLPDTCKLPEVNTDPVNICLSSRLSPNFVEPDSNSIDEEISLVWKESAYTSPSTLNPPEIITD